MKKLLALLLATVMVFMLFGCDNTERPVLRVAMSPDFAPMEFVDTTKTGQDRFVGFDVSLAKYLADGMDRRLEIVPMSFEACQDAVSSGEVDMAISGFSWLPQREERFNLSSTYQAGNNSNNQLLLTMADHASAFGTPESLIGIPVGVQEASLQEWLVQQQLPDAQIVTYPDVGSGVELLYSGAIQAMAVAEGNANAILAENPELTKAEFRFEVSEELTDNLILLPKGDDAMTMAVNDLLAAAEAAGYYPVWYAEALELAGIGIEEHYDDQGHPAQE